MKVFIGLTEIAGHIKDYQYGYEKNNCTVKTFVWKKNSHFLDKDYDLVFSDGYSLNKNNYFLKFISYIRILVYKYIRVFSLLLWADVAHFIWPGNSIKWRIVFPIVKFLKPKLKIVVSFVGDDVRWRHARVQESELHHLKLSESFYQSLSNYNLNYLKQKLELTRVFEKYASIILGTPDSSQLFLRPYYHYFLPMILPKYQNIREKSPIKSNQIYIVHAATEKNIKSSDLIEETLRKVAERNKQVVYNVYYNLPNEQLLEELNEADILLYNPNSTSVGKLGLEALLLNCIVLTGYNNSYNKYPINGPIIEIDPDNILAKLLYAIELTEQERLDFKENGRNWAEENFDVVKITSKLIECLYAGKQITKSHYPNFLFDQYQPVFGQEEVKLINRYTRRVKSCYWYLYKNSTFQRNGLKF